MTKTELTELLQSLNIPINEGASSINSTNKFPYLVFWDYIWDCETASDEVYADIETYQVSFFAKQPRHPKLLELRQKLRAIGINPTIYHEYIQEDKVFHSYMSIETYV